MLKPHFTQCHSGARVKRTSPESITTIVSMDFEACALPRIPGRQKMGQSRSALTKRLRQIVEQFVYREGPRNKSLLRGVSDDYLERTTHILRTEMRRDGRSMAGLHQNPRDIL